MVGNRFNNSVIYKIIDNEDKIVYIGCTTHKHLYKNLYEFKKRNKYTCIFNIILLETFPCENINELKARCYYWKQKLLMNIHLLVMFINFIFNCSPLLSI